MKTIRYVLLSVVCLSATAFAVSPPPDGGYPDGNTAEGDDALFSLTTGDNNTAIGFDALYSNDTGSANTAVGSSALTANTSGGGDTAVGSSALSANTSGSENTALGAGALLLNTTGGSNTAVGADALFYSTTGLGNTAIGFSALAANTTGSSNTATGVGVLGLNQSGQNNTATGANALSVNAGGSNNTAIGQLSMAANVTGTYNTALGQGSLYHNTIGSNNTAIGQNALFKESRGKDNIAIGSNAGYKVTDGSSNIEIGNLGVIGDSNTIRVGTQGTQTATFVAGISGATVAEGVAVIVDTNGHLGTVVSSARYKEAIKPMDKASEAILSLHPVTFRYKKELDPVGIPQFGLVAEDVAHVDPDLVARDEKGKPYTVRYEAVNAMLLNEFLKEHRNGELQDRKIEEQNGKQQRLEATIAQQQREIAALTAAVKAQASQIQKVSSRLELGETATRVAAREP